MAGGGALPALPPTPPAQKTKEQLQQAVAMNAIRLQAIGDRLRAHFRGGSAALVSADIAHLVYAFARGIDYALSGGDVPKVASEIPDILKKVYQLREDQFLQSSVMVLIISCKNACFNKWFQPAESIDILRMANEFSGNFCTPLSQPANDSTVLEIISTVITRYYPQLKFKRLVTSLEAKVGYDILMADFFIHRNLPRDEKINLIVVQKENLDASSCISSPPHVSFLVNGKGVDKRTNVSMETGPQFPSDITKMLKYGANIIQAVGYFNANYIIAVAFVNNLRSVDAPKLDDYAQPVTTDPPDSDILEGPSRVSLKCPISFRRIRTPIKGRLCKHYQCFDYDNYMEMNLRKPTWRCPCCNTPSNFIDLRIDQKMAKVLQESDDITDILVFPDGSWKTVSVHDEESDRHASEIIQQNGDTVETDATPSHVIDLINGNGDGDLPMSFASASEDMKPLLNSQDLSEADCRPDLPISTTAHVGGNNGCSNVTSTSIQNSLVPSTGGPGSSSFGTLESILPQDILHPVITDAVSPSLGTSNSTFAMQHVLQGTHPNIVQLQSLIDPLPRSEVSRPPIPRNVRREPVAVQALAARPQNPGLSRRVQPNVFNCPPPIPQSNLASSTYKTHQMTNADSVITAMNTGVGPLSRAPDAASLMHLQSTQQDHNCWQDMLNTSSHLHGRVIGPHLMGIRPPLGGPGQARDANAYAAPPMQQHQHFDQLLVSNLMSQLVQAPPPRTVEVPQAMPSSNLMSQLPQAPPPGTVEVPQVMPTQPGSTISPDIQSHLFSPQLSQAVRLQAMTPRPAIPQAPPRLQCASLPPAAPTPSVPPHVGISDGLPELPVEQNWRPTGRMRGSLTGPAYSQALERYLNTAGQQTSQARPPGTDARR